MGTLYEIQRFSYRNILISNYIFSFIKLFVLRYQITNLLHFLERAKVSIFHVGPVSPVILFLRLLACCGVMCYVSAIMYWNYSSYKLNIWILTALINFDVNLVPLTCANVLCINMSKNICNTLNIEYKLNQQFRDRQIFSQFNESIWRLDFKFKKWCSVISQIFSMINCRENYTHFNFFTNLLNIIFTRFGWG